MGLREADYCIKRISTTEILYNTVKKGKVAQSCPTLCDPMDYTVHGILQARTLEWVAFLFFSCQPRDQTQVSSSRQVLCQLSHRESQESWNG